MSRLASRFRSRRDDAGSERGAAVVEFLLALPAFLAAAGIVIGAGWLGTVKAIVDHGAREGARFAAIADERGTYPDATAVADAVENSTPLVSPTAVLTSGEDQSRNAPVQVEVAYEVSNPLAALFAPVAIFGFDNPVPTSVTFTSREEVRRE